jgi:hypothetical protein
MQPISVSQGTGQRALEGALPSSPTTGYGHVGCLLDGSEASQSTIQAASGLRRGDGVLSVLFCDASPACPLIFPMGEIWIPDLEELREGTRAWLSDLVRVVHNAEGVLLEGSPAWSLAGWARLAEPDLLVMAEPRRRFGWASGALRVDRLSRALPCPLLVLPDTGQAQRRAAATRPGSRKRFIPAMGR